MLFLDRTTFVYTTDGYKEKRKQSTDNKQAKSKKQKKKKKRLINKFEMSINLKRRIFK